jgi:LuxR family maltose regulon positive regulatory protein
VLNVLSAEPADTWLVLDDYHVVQDESVQRGMEFLLEHAPPALHAVIASRVDLPLQLGRWRARGELTEIRAADLRFTGEEAAQFLNQTMSLSLASEQVALLEARTEGWAGALQLAALSLRDREQPEQFIREFSGDQRYILDYLVEEVLARQTAEVRDFLLRTSVLERLSAPLCNAVTAETNARAMLDTLERSNLFLIALDDRRQWFRYHHLFADVLRAHLREALPESEASLHLRASEWFAATAEPEAAIQHALAAGDAQRAAGLIELEAERVVRAHRPDQLVEWLKPIPRSVTAKMPVLSTFAGHALQGLGDMEASAASLDDAERAAASDYPVVFDQRNFAALPSLIAVGRGYLAMARRDAAATVRHATVGLELIPPEEHHWRGTAVALLGLAHWIRGDLEPAERFHAEAVANFEQAGDTGLAITSAYHHAELLKARGRLRDARRRLEASLAFVREQHGGAASRYAANLHLGLSEICCEEDDFEGAARELANAEQLGIYPPRTPFRACCTRARLLQSQGQFESALAELAEAARLQVRGAVPDYRPIAAWQARLNVAAGRIPEALAWASERGLSAGDRLHYEREYEHLTLARVLLARRAADDPGKAEGLLQRLVDAAEAGGRLGVVIEASMLLAQARWLSDQREPALAAIERSLLLAEPQGYARTFLDEGEQLAPILRAAREAGLAPAYCSRLLAALVTPEPRPARKTADGEELTERELEVLRLLASELSGPEMAAQLVVSLNTLRTHTKNVYAKLGASSRRAAVRRATELGLL